eukprot:COSAG01_NODE_10_length_42970_cov_93.010007_33_plen_61_part_00
MPMRPARMGRQPRRGPQSSPKPPPPRAEVPAAAGRPSCVVNHFAAAVVAAVSGLHATVVP